jgi:hypothetical protein
MLLVGGGLSILSKWFYSFFCIVTLLNHKTKEGNCIGHILRKNRLLESAVEGKIRGKGRRRRRRKQIVYEDTETCKRKH